MSVDMNDSKSPLDLASIAKRMAYGEESAINEYDSLLAGDKDSVQSILAYIVENIKNYEMSEYAVERINDPDLLTIIAKNESLDSWARYMAIINLADGPLRQAILADLATNSDSDSEVRFGAVEALLNQDDVLAEVAINDCDDSICKFAAERIASQSALAEVAKNAEYEEVRLMAIGELFDKEVLVEIAKNNSLDLCLCYPGAAVSRLCEICGGVDEEPFIEIAKNANDIEICEDAIANIQSIKALEDIEKNTPHLWLKELVRKKLSKEDL